MRIAVDLDGVCYEFQRTFCYMMREHRGVDIPHPDDFWFRWDSQLQYGTPEDHKWMWTEGVKRGLFRYGHMVKGARRGLEKLVEQGHEIVFVTHRPMQATPDTVDWLSLYLNGLPYSLHILTNGENKVSVRWDALIDDKAENIQAAWEASRIGILFQQPWNDSYISPRGVYEVGGWHEMDKGVEYAAAFVSLGA